jgi:nucleoside-diphosphate-sugar epimerase
MKIVITGATGFVANALVNRLIQGNHEVYVVVRESSNISSISKDAKLYVDRGDTHALNHFFADINPDGVVHLASLVLVEHSSDDIAPLIHSNILFGTRLLEAASKSDTKWFINTGTFWQHYNNEDYNPVNLYAATKEAFEVMAKYYYETQGIDFVTLKLNDTFGEGDTRKKIFNLWRSLEKSGESLGMSPGEQIIDISYIENIIDAYCQLIDNMHGDNEHKYNGKSFALNADERMSLKSLSKIYEKVTNSKLNIVWGERPYRDREVMTPWNRGESVPGWKQKISLEDAIVRVINSEEEN